LFEKRIPKSHPTEKTERKITELQLAVNIFWLPVRQLGGGPGDKLAQTHGYNIQKQQHKNKNNQQCCLSFFFLSR
jgi:hypothetical protein